MSGFIPVLTPTSWTDTHRPVDWPDPLDLTGHSWHLSYSLHGLLYVLFLYLDVPLLAVFIHLLFTS